MDKPLPNLVQNPMVNAFQPKEYPQKAQGMSFFAFVFFVIIYISIFYIFNLTPSKLVKTTKFWFFISNTLILIIAVDYGAFSSSKNKHDLYQECIMSRERISARSVRTRYPEVEVVKTNIPEEERKEFHEKRTTTTHQRIGIPEIRWASVPQSDSTKRSVSFRENKQQSSIKHDHHERISGSDFLVIPKKDASDDHKTKVGAKPFQRSKSDTTKRVVFDESRNVIRRVETENYELQDLDEEENEYANMSNEELNRRFEDFIQRFNRQIRLQGDACSRVRQAH